MAQQLPIEFRQYMPKFTLEHLKMGIQPIKMPVGPPGPNGQSPLDLFMPPTLQYRAQVSVHVNGAPKKEWTPWIECPLVKEGDDLLEPAA